MPRIFITGSGGFIGRALCAKMLENGWDVTGAFRSESSRKSLPVGVNGKQIGSIETYDGSRKEMEGIDVVIHLAGLVHVINRGASGQFDVFRRVNVGGTQRLARAAARAGVKKFIFISSVKVNGESSQSAITEKDIPAPQDAYGISKYEAEKALKQISDETGLKTVILRLPLVYGPGVKANFESLIRLVASGLPLPFKNIRNRRSFIYIGNLTDVILKTATHPKALGETFMVSDCEDISTPDLVKLIASAMDKKVKLFSAPPFFLNALAGLAGKREAVEKLTGSLYVDTGKIRDMVGWKPPFSLKEGIENTIRNHRL